MTTLQTLKPQPGSRRSRKRIGRGEGSGRGCTAGKGHKGQRARSGAKISASFEGGQMPLMRRLPKFGFTNVFRQEVAVVNLRDLNRFEKGAEVTPDSLREKGLLRSRHQGPVKILGQGEIDRALTVRVHRFSKTAKAAIEKAGGKAEEITA